MDKFQDIRPYNDNEVRSTLDRLIHDDEFINALATYKFPSMVKFVPGLVKMAIRFFVTREVKGVNDISSLQDIIEKYMSYMINGSTQSFTVSGIEHLKSGRSYLFMSNHRDIAMDPALVDYALYHHGHSTVRIAIGDNLLTKPYVTDLMKLNKSFIVKRSETGPKATYKALKHLAAYIHHSITVDQHNIWIAHREGRAKDGLDRTDQAIIKMFAVNKKKKDDFGEYIQSLHLLPISLSYELDPCDTSKGAELYQKSKDGSYEKGEQEDVKSIAAGIAGDKGHVHIHFGEELTQPYETAEEVTKELDRQIINNYVLHPTNFFAYNAIYGHYPKGLCSAEGVVFNIDNLKQDEAVFLARINENPQEWRETILNMYANPIVSKEQLCE